VNEVPGAVFLSYASEDAEAAQRICAALRAAGVDVWFDQSELRGGDAWDHKIREQIRDCALLIPVISQHTQERLEGYFRREWRLAVDRTMDMADNRAFLVPVVIDDTAQRTAHVPAAFNAGQWTKLPGGQTPEGFVDRVTQLLAPGPVPGRQATAGVAPTTRTTNKPRRVLVAAAASIILAACLFFLVSRFWVVRPPSAVLAPPAPASSAGPGFSPPAHSIAVLPFVNLSGDKDQEYFSEGLTEELLNSLAAIDGLQVAARTSSFSFKEHPDVAAVARKLNVAAVLEGSVRRSGNTVRITAQLVNALTGFQLWSKVYDRDLKDVLKLQSDVATTVASALKVTLDGDVAAKIELGGTRNPAAFDAYLHGSKSFSGSYSEKGINAAIAAYSEAINLDPGYALAYADRSLAFIALATAGDFDKVRGSFERALDDAQQALRLAPEMPRAHLAHASYLENGALDFASATAEFERAVTLAPGDARVQRLYGEFSALMCHTTRADAAARRAVVLDPLSPLSHAGLGWVLYLARQYTQSLAAHTNALMLGPDIAVIRSNFGDVYYALGDFEHAQTECSMHPFDPFSQLCLAIVYNKLGRRPDAESELAKAKVSMGASGAYQYAATYAQWGQTKAALEWLDTAFRLRSPDLETLKTDPLIDPLRGEPRFKAIERALNFPP
jgi:TolB-like protein/Flp pilus assembly protein TadD